jgi:hypothetical protein
MQSQDLTPSNGSLSPISCPYFSRSQQFSSPTAMFPDFFSTQSTLGLQQYLNKSTLPRSTNMLEFRATVNHDRLV